MSLLVLDRRQSNRLPEDGISDGRRKVLAVRHKNSLWRQTAVMLPPPAAANLFFTVGRSKKIQDHESGGS
jgi:hypothetical protein